MNMYNPLSATKRLEATGLKRNQAEAIASEINEGTSDLVTKEQLFAALDKQTIRISIIVGAMITLATTLLGAVTAALTLS